MFLKTGESIFGNTGLITALIILLLLTVLSYSKCSAFTNHIKNDHFTVPSPTTTNSLTVTKPEPTNVRINVKGRDLTVDFSFPYGANKEIPKSFMVLLVQYDSNLKPTGELKLFESNEYEINPSVAINEKSFNNNLCVMNNDIPSCKYTINNLDVTDFNGNIYFYKLGVMAIYNDNNSRIVTPYNVNTQNGLFSLDTSLNLQNKQFADFKAFKVEQNKTNIGSSYSNTMSTADGQYELIKSQLGNYPSDLILDTSVKNPALLNDLVDKSMALGMLNVDISVDNIDKQKT